MIINDDNFTEAIARLSSFVEIGTDTETSGLDVRHNTDYLMGFCFSVPGFSCYMPFRHKADNISMKNLSIVEQLLQQKDLIWHNRKFDMHSVKTIGIDPLSFKGKQYDTLMLAQLYNEELYSKELDFLAKWYLKKEKIDEDRVHKFGELFGYNNMPVELYREYAPQDAILTRELKEFLWPRILREELDTVYWNTEAPFTEILYLIEQRGLGVDLEFCEKKAKFGRGRMGSIRRELKLNPSSPLALKKLLIDELKLPILEHTSSCDYCKNGQPINSHEGKPSFNKRVMEDYDDILQESSNPTAVRVAEYRGWQKAVTSLYEPLLRKVGPDGLIRTEFKQHGTVTGRLSSHDPNLQQIPRSSPKIWNGDAKSAFTSGREGFTVIGWDYSQLELRLGASYGQEKLLLAEFEKSDSDPFAVLAPIIFGILTENTRQDTKTFVYANLFGAGLRKIMLMLGRPEEEVKILYENYKNSIPGIMAVSKQVDLLIKQRGYIKYWDGRRRHFKNRGDSYKGWNSLLQGGGAQLVKQAMIRCREFEDENCFMVLQVHDEITFCIRTEMIPHYEPMITKAMTDWPNIGVKMSVEGKAWK